MLETAASSGFVKLGDVQYPRLQILTLKEYFRGKRTRLPDVNITFKAATTVGKSKKNQIEMRL